jgi:AcrR family transcriptional regulator
MGSPSTARRISARHYRSATPAPETRYDRRLAEILNYATEVFCKKGYEGASMRDLSRESGMSLAGLYYYFESKERAPAVSHPETHLRNDCAAAESAA